MVTLWFEGFDESRSHYTNFGHDNLPLWTDRWENRLRCERLRQIGLGGIFNSIILVARDPRAEPKEIAERYIGPRMRLTRLNEATGEFDAERVT